MFFLSRHLTGGLKISFMVEDITILTDVFTISLKLPCNFRILKICTKFPIFEIRNGWAFRKSRKSLISPDRLTSLGFWLNLSI